jgi:hypothetical protein
MDLSALIDSFGAATEEEILSACHAAIPQIMDYQDHAVPWLISIIHRLVLTDRSQEAADLITALRWKAFDLLLCPPFLSSPNSATSSQSSSRDLCPLGKVR